MDSHLNRTNEKKETEKEAEYLADHLQLKGKRDCDSHWKMFLDIRGIKSDPMEETKPFIEKLET